ncbi:MAG TPA: hypothetical protein VHW26_05000 [Solirubrobacteraceae bacterium]|jgi:hypothetical protein|nr:hypothetical protein [Solirubrobacteraceae bacterium]
MTIPPGHLAAHPLPPGIVGALVIPGYQLLAEIAGVGAGRLGSDAFLLAVADPTPDNPDPGTQISLHYERLDDEAELPAFTQLAAQLGYLRLSGYRVALEREGLRSKLSLVDPATGRIVAVIPARHARRMKRKDPATAPNLLAALRALPAAGSPPDPQDPELLRQVILGLALQDDAIGGAEAVELTDRAIALTHATPTLDPPAALAAARRELTT